uniref:Uncharacterized protein AlNc14C1G168 n=1 Tax=Albugo laibachii Nc14 TaxID=890382 RepID=F0VZ25_9STRA|nr:conserved hypothetical protein [Albugo laibachii Nc14]|eukprot:CCA14040.1 conserved hypothetical protein [Albugo laibachii Nc14]
MNTTERLSIIDENGKIKAITIDSIMSLGDVVVTNLEITPKPPSLTDRIGLSNIGLITQIRSQSIGYSHAHNGSLYTELIVSTRGRSYCIHRELGSFYHIMSQSQRRLSAILAKDNVIPSVQIPACPISTSTDDAAIVLWCTEMNQFLRGSWHEIKLDTDVVVNTAVWRFVIGDHDIEFCVTFTPKGGEESIAEIVHDKTRYVADDKNTPIEGMYQTGGPGTVVLIWNNSFSRIRGKNITYQAQIVAGEVLESAKVAADALDEINSSSVYSESNLGDVLALDVRRSPESDARPPNYPSLQYLTALGTGWIGQVPFSVAHKLGIGGNGFMQGNQVVQEKELICIPDLDNVTSAKDILCKKIMDRLENLEDQVAILRGKMHSNLEAFLMTEATEQENVLKAMQSDLQRLQHEQIVWKDIQMERDALLEEKHHWESVQYC